MVEQNHKQKHTRKPPFKKTANNRQAFGDAWLACLRLPLSPALYRRVLVFLPGNVIPYMPSPVRLADFLTAAYGLGGVQSVLALDALFLLMQVRVFCSLSLSRRRCRSTIVAGGGGGGGGGGISEGFVGLFLM